MTPKINADHINKDRPTFMVLGTPRSGTTLLAALLGSHPEIAMLDEDLNGGVLAVTGNKLPGVKLCVPAQIHPTGRKNWLTKMMSLSGGLRNRFTQWRTHSTLSLADYEGARAMRYVCLIRSPAPNLASIKVRAGKRAHIAERIVQDGLQMILEIAQDPARKTLVLSYEDLVSDTEAQLRRLCAFLDTPFDPQMMEGARHNHRYKNTGIHKGENTSATGLTAAPENIMQSYEALKALI